ncbi:MAG: DUF6152 family protein [Steroidobacteraceae bacterium]
MSDPWFSTMETVQYYEQMARDISPDRCEPLEAGCFRCPTSDIARAGIARQTGSTWSMLLLNGLKTVAHPSWRLPLGRVCRARADRFVRILRIRTTMVAANSAASWLPGMTAREEIHLGKAIRAMGMLAAMCAAMLCAPAGAHHSFAVFFDDARGIVSVRGVVTEFIFKNPHGIIRLNVKGKNGATEVWKAETNSPSILERRGWKKDSIKVGDQIIVEGWRARDGANYMRMRKVTRADGTPIGVPFETMEVR